MREFGNEGHCPHVRRAPVSIHRDCRRQERGVRISIFVTGTWSGRTNVGRHTLSYDFDPIIVGRVIAFDWEF